jgi:dCTP deaminase
MAVLSDISIKANVQSGQLVIDPYNERNVQPSSYDLTLLGDAPIRLLPVNYYTGRAVNRIIDAFIELIATLSNENENDTGPDITRFNNLADKLTSIREDNAPHGAFQLLSTRERIELPATCQGEVHGRSSLARKGVFVHVSAGFIDPGFRGQITLECINVSKDPVDLLPGDRVAQIVFTELNQKAENPYSGRYQDQEGATKSRFKHGMN